MNLAASAAVAFALSGAAHAASLRPANSSLRLICDSTGCVRLEAARIRAVLDGPAIRHANVRSVAVIQPTRPVNELDRLIASLR